MVDDPLSITFAALADRSGGNSYFAETPEDAPGIFGEEFEGLTSLVVQNLSVEIRPLDPVELVGVDPASLTGLDPATAHALKSVLASDPAGEPEGATHRRLPCRAGPR